MQDITTILSAAKLRNTLPRRAVIAVLMQSKEPLLPLQVHAKVAAQVEGVNVATVYRILEKLQKAHVVHEHTGGGLSVCTVGDAPGHHVLLRCQSCNVVQECVDSSLCKAESAVAAQFGFSRLHHVTELIGSCSHCS